MGAFMREGAPGRHERAARVSCSVSSPRMKGSGANQDGRATLSGGEPADVRHRPRADERSQVWLLARRAVGRASLPPVVRAAGLRIGEAGIPRKAGPHRADRRAENVQQVFARGRSSLISLEAGHESRLGDVGPRCLASDTPSSKALSSGL